MLDRLADVRAVTFVRHGPIRGHRSGGTRGSWPRTSSVFPELVIPMGPDGVLAVDYAGLAGVLVGAVNELRAATATLVGAGSGARGPARAGRRCPRMTRLSTSSTSTWCSVSSTRTVSCSTFRPAARSPARRATRTTRPARTPVMRPVLTPVVRPARRRAVRPVRPPAEPPAGRPARPPATRPATTRPSRTRTASPADQAARSRDHVGGPRVCPRVCRRTCG